MPGTRSTSASSRNPSGLRISGARLVLVLALSGTALAGERFGVQAVDAATGRQLEDVRWTLQDPKTKKVYGRYENGEYKEVGSKRPTRAISPGDVLWTYVRGYNLYRRVLTGAHPVTIPLNAAPTCTLRLEGPKKELARIELISSVYVWAKTREERHNGPMRDVEFRKVQGGLFQVPVPNGLAVSLTVSGLDCLVWPRGRWITAGKEYVVKYEPPRILPVVTKTGWIPKSHTRCLADFLWTPTGGVDRVEALKNAAHDGPWVQPDAQRIERLHLFPGVPFHFFTIVDKRPVYRYVSPTDEQIDLRDEEEPLLVLSRPTVDERPVPKGTLFAAGKLDTLTMNMLATWRHAACRVLPDPSELWAPTSMPAHDWLTVYHQDVGVCHIRWHKGRPPAGESYPGSIRVDVPEGHEVKGSVAVFPMWRGTGRTVSMPPDRYLRKSFSRKRSLAFPSLPEGWYLIDARVRLNDGRRTYEPRIHTRVHITAENPKHVHLLR